MIITEFDQGSPDWFHSRLGIPTASMANSVMSYTDEMYRVVRPSGTTVRKYSKKEDAQWHADTDGFEIETIDAFPGESRISYALELACQRVTGKFDDNVGDTGWWADRGNELEPLAREYYEFLTGTQVMECGLCLTDDEKVGASLDGIPGDESHLEIKCLRRVKHMNAVLADEVPGEFKAQVQMQLLVTQRPWADVFLYHPNAPVRGHIIRVEPDNDYQALLRRRLDTFEAEVVAMVAKLELLAHGAAGAAQ